MSTNGNGNGQSTELEVMEARIRAEFPPDEPAALHRLMVRIAARDELYHRAVESMVEELGDIRETVRNLKCLRVTECPAGGGLDG